MFDLDKYIKEARKALEFYSLGKLMKDGLKEVGWKNTDDLLLSNMEKDQVSGLFLTPEAKQENLYYGTVPAPWVSYKFHFTSSWIVEELKPDKSEFDVNMMEALLGWREWHIDIEKGVIRGLSHPEIWHPAECPEAVCKMHGQKHPIPGEFCTCGFYARDERPDPCDYALRVCGEVYGWGRYVRGDSGWRCQYAYPKSFHANRNVTPAGMDVLKKYRVPIFVEQPVLMYNPEEDGYEYRNDEENWNLRSGTESDADQDSYEGEAD